MIKNRIIVFLAILITIVLISYYLDVNTFNVELASKGITYVSGNMILKKIRREALVIFENGSLRHSDRIKVKSPVIHNKSIVLSNKSKIIINIGSGVENLTIHSEVNLARRQYSKYPPLVTLIDDSRRWIVKFLYYNYGFSSNLYGLELWDLKNKTIIQKRTFLIENYNFNFTICKNSTAVVIYIDGIERAHIHIPNNFAINRIVIGSYGSNYVIGIIQRLIVIDKYLNYNDVLILSFGANHVKHILYQVLIKQNTYVQTYRITRTLSYVLMLVLLFCIIITKLLNFIGVKAKFSLSTCTLLYILSIALIWRLYSYYNIAWGDLALHSVDLIHSIRYYFFPEKLVIPAYISITPQTIPSFLFNLMLIDVPTILKLNPYIVITTFSICIAMFSTYVLLRNLLNINMILSFFGALLYVVNPISALFVNWTGPVLMAYAMIPLLVTITLSTAKISLEQEKYSLLKVSSPLLIVLYLVYGIFPHILMISVIHLIILLMLLRFRRNFIHIFVLLVGMSILLLMPYAVFQRILMATHEIKDLYFQLNYYYSSMEPLRIIDMTGPKAMQFWSPFSEDIVVRLMNIITFVISMISLLYIRKLNKIQRLFIFYFQLLIVLSIIVALIFHYGVISREILRHPLFSNIVAVFRNSDRIYLMYTISFVALSVYSIERLLYSSPKIRTRAMLTIALVLIMLWCFAYRPALDGAITMYTLKRFEPGNRYSIVLPLTAMIIRNDMQTLSKTCEPCKALYTLLPFDEIPIGRYFGYKEYFLNIRSLYKIMSGKYSMSYILNMLAKDRAINIIVLSDFTKNNYPYDPLLNTPSYYLFRYTSLSAVVRAYQIRIDHEENATFSLLVISPIRIEYKDELFRRTLVIRCSQSSNDNEGIRIPIAIINSLNANRLIVDNGVIRNETLIIGCNTKITVETPLSLIIVYNIPFFISLCSTILMIFRVKNVDRKKRRNHTVCTNI